MRHIASIVILVLIGLNAQAEMHKWVDEDGKVHYSDALPPGAKSPEAVRNFSGNAEPGASASPAPKSIAEREAELRKAKLEKEEAARKATAKDAENEARRRNCENAQNNIRILQDGTRVVSYNEKGERTYMDEESKARALEEAQKAVEQNCD